MRGAGAYQGAGSFSNGTLRAFDLAEFGSAGVWLGPYLTKGNRARIFFFRLRCVGPTGIFTSFLSV